MVPPLRLLRVLNLLPAVILIFLSADDRLIRPDHRWSILLSQVMHLFCLLPEVVSNSGGAHRRQIVIVR